MLNRIPLGSTRGIVSHCQGQPERVGDLRLQFGLKGAVAVAVAAASVSEQQQFSATVIPCRAFVAPPAGDGLNGKRRRVMRDAHSHSAAVGADVINAVRNGNAKGVGAEVVIVDQQRRKAPARTWILEVSHQLTLLGVNAEDGLAPALKLVAKIADVQKLLIAIGTRIGGQLFVVDAQRLAHLMEQPRHGVGADGDAIVGQRHRDSGGGAAGPLQSSDRVARRVVVQQKPDQGDDVGCFFSTVGRPAPERRVRPETTSWSNSCCRPRATV